MPIFTISSRQSYLRIPIPTPVALKGGLAVLLFITGPLHAASALTLQEATRLALEKEPAFRGANHRVEIASAQSRQSGLWQNPQLQFVLEDWPVDGAGWSASKRIVGLAQTIPFPGKKTAERKMGESGIRVAQAELMQQRRELIRNVKVAFYESLATRELVAARAELVRTAELLADSVKHRVGAGGGSGQETLRAEIPLERARIDWMDSQRDFAIARRKLAQFIGKSDLGPMELQGDLSGPQQGKVPELPAKHPLRLVAQENIRRAELANRRAHLEVYPDVSLGIGIGKEGGGNGTLGQVEVGIPLPLFDTSRGKREEARANRLLAEAQAQAVELRIGSDWRNALDRIRLAEEQALVFQQRIVPKSEAALEQVQAGFEQGKFGVVDLLETQRNAAETKVGFQQKLLELNIARADLEALAGQPEH